MERFLYQIGDRIRLKESEEHGEVIGRAEYQGMEDHYYIRYRAGDGRQVTHWWGESDIAGTA